MKEIKLTQGKIALVDDEDFDRLNQFKWCTLKNGNVFYATRNIRINKKQITIYMQWDILNGKYIDHIDNNGLNNQRINLRFCTNSQNQMNKRKRKNTSSIYKGVYFNKRDKKWMSYINIKHKFIFIGYFNLESDAAKSYNQKAIELFGEFARVNIIN